MKNLILFISICLLVLSNPSYSQTKNSFSGYLLGVKGIINKENEFANPSNFSPTAGLDLHLKRFTLGLEGSKLNTTYIDLMGIGNTGAYYPEILGSNNYESFQLLFGPGFDIISSKKVNINISGKAGLNFITEENSEVNLTISNPGEKFGKTFLLAKRELIDEKPSKLILSPSLSLNYQLSKSIAVMFKASYIHNTKSKYLYTKRNLEGMIWYDYPMEVIDELMHTELQYKETEVSPNFVNIGIGLNITLWSKDIKQNDKEKVKGCPSDKTVCIDEENFTLSGALPIGGVYSGQGVTNNIFSPSDAGQGAHLISYNLPGSNNPCSFVITVKPRPDMTSPADTTVFFDSGEFDLKGAEPKNGEYSGKGVSNGKFNPAVAGGGAHKITYTYQEEESCEDTCAFTIYVLKYYYELTKNPSAGYVEFFGDTLNIQFSNSYASTNKIYMDITDVDTQKKMDKKIAKSMKERELALNNINGLNRISIGLKNYELQPGRFYQLKLSDSKNYYYLNFKIFKTNLLPANFDSKDDIIK